jgi:hypothetical protein
MAHFGDFLNAKNPLESSFISEMIIIFELKQCIYIWEKEIFKKVTKIFKSDPKCKHFCDFIKLRNLQKSQKIWKVEIKNGFQIWTPWVYPET